jgi:Zn-finger protein
MQSRLLAEGVPQLVRSANVVQLASDVKQCTQDATWEPRSLHPLKERCTLEVICTRTGKVVWSCMKCHEGIETGTECCIQKQTTVIRKVLCHGQVKDLEVQRLGCVAHDHKFTVTGSTKTWAHVERMEQEGKVIVQPKIVVLSDMTVLTMEAYRCASEIFLNWVSQRDHCCTTPLHHAVLYDTAQNVYHSILTCLKHLLLLLLRSAFTRAYLQSAIRERVLGCCAGLSESECNEPWTSQEQLQTG